MLVKIAQCHKYRGSRIEGEHGARPQTIYPSKSVLEVPAEYYERHLKPYGAKPIDLTADAHDDVRNKLDDVSVVDLREIAERRNVAPDEGTGRQGRIIKSDYVTAIMGGLSATELEEELSSFDFDD